MTTQDQVNAAYKRAGKLGRERVRIDGLTAECVTTLRLLVREAVERDRKAMQCEADPAGPVAVAAALASQYGRMQAALDAAHKREKVQRYVRAYNHAIELDDTRREARCPACGAWHDTEQECD